jgi:hypothetical protein
VAEKVRRRHIRTVVGIGVAGLLAAACGGHVPKPAAGSPGLPDVTWVIMHGDHENPDREFACQSTPRNDCVVPVSAPHSRVFTDVHFYYHGAGTDTAFTGTVTLGFLEGGSASKAFDVKATADRPGTIGRQSITGIVSSSPGTYEVAINVIGTVGGAEQGHTIQETIPVVLR